MNIVVLLKAVPVVGTERLGSDLLTDRSVQLEAKRTTAPASDGAVAAATGGADWS